MKKIILAAALLSSQISFAQTNYNDLFKHQLNSSLKLFFDAKDKSHIKPTVKCRLAGAANALVTLGLSSDEDMLNYVFVTMETTYAKFAEPGSNVPQTIYLYLDKNCSQLN